MSSEPEAVRKELNGWLMHQSISDVDFSSVIADTANDSMMRSDLHIGDYLHPNSEGGSVMANTVLQKEII